MPSLHQLWVPLKRRSAAAATSGAVASTAPGYGTDAATYFVGGSGLTIISLGTARHSDWRGGGKTPDEMYTDLHKRLAIGSCKRCVCRAQPTVPVPVPLPLPLPWPSKLTVLHDFLLDAVQVGTGNPAVGGCAMRSSSSAHRRSCCSCQWRGPCDMRMRCCSAGSSGDSSWGPHRFRRVSAS